MALLLFLPAGQASWEIEELGTREGNVVNRGSHREMPLKEVITNVGTAWAKLTKL